MAKYDSPEFVNPIPGDDGYSHDNPFRAPGSSPAAPAELGGVNVPVTAPAGRPTDDTANVGPDDTQMPAQQAIYGPGGEDLISGATGLGTTGAGQGTVHAPRAPGAGNHS